MLKGILKLNGVVELKKEEQDAMKGGFGSCLAFCVSDADCESGCQCICDICQSNF